MRISNSKKQLAKIIHENGGWPVDAESAAQCIRGEISFWHNTATKRVNEDWCGRYLGVAHDIQTKGQKLPNWHQTLLSRDEYFHLYPAPDADGWIEWKSAFYGEMPVPEGTEVDIMVDGTVYHRYVAEVWKHWGTTTKYRLYKGPVSTPDAGVKVTVENQTTCHLTVTDKPTIEQLAADYRNRKDYADRKQQEADAAKADAEAKRAELVAAGKALGLVLSVAGVEPELVITDWQDLLEGDEIEVFNFECPESESRRKQELMSGPCVVVQVEDGNVRIELKKNLPTKGSHWNATGVDACDFKFIRRPAKGGTDA